MIFHGDSTEFFASNSRSTLSIHFLRHSLSCFELGRDGRCIEKREVALAGETKQAPGDAYDGQGCVHRGGKSNAVHTGWQVYTSWTKFRSKHLEFHDGSCKRESLGTVAPRPLNVCGCRDPSRPVRLLNGALLTCVQVLTLIVSEYVLLEMPERFWLWYTVIVPVLLLMRYPSYARRKWQFFYLDFCYYVQVRL